jgi:hypothetical protein
MTDSITPPPELVEKLQDLGNLDAIALAYRAGADQELEACCEWVMMETPASGVHLRAARRPKPPSLKEQALELARPAGTEGAYVTFGPEELELIRRALKELPE